MSGRPPKGWAHATLGEVTVDRVSQDGPPKTGRFTYIDISSVDNDAKSVGEPKVLSAGSAPSRARQRVRAGDVLVSMTRPNLNAVALLPEQFDGAIASTGFDVLRSVCVDPRWLFAHVRSKGFIEQMAARTRGALYPAVSSGEIRAYGVLLPPLREQRRIAEKITVLDSHSRAARKHLEAIPPLLEQFRASVLSAAFSGRLTADWRAAQKRKGVKIESARVLLERIRAERRKRWEEEQLVRMEALGRNPKDDSWKERYKEPEDVDANGLPELPAGWAWTTWAAISDWITYGFTRPMPHVTEGPAIVTAKNISGGTILLDNVHRTTTEAYNALSEKDRPKPGDILITKDGTIGRAAVVKDEALFCINQSVGVIWLRSCPINRTYLLAAIESPLTRTMIAAHSKGVALQHLSITDFGRMPLPVAPLAEQTEIEVMLRAKFGITRQTVESVTASSQALADLNDAILATAFRGELVPQDPKDEPAAELLARVHEEGVREPSKRRGASHA